MLTFGKPPVTDVVESSDVDPDPKWIRIQEICRSGSIQVKIGEIGR